MGKKRRSRADAVANMVESMDYKIARLLHSGRLLSLDAIETHGSVDLCDYLFYPAEAANCVVGTELTMNTRTNPILL